jgi:O-antigen ligase
VPRTHPCHRIAFVLLATSVGLAPLPFGGATGWFDGAFAAGTGLLLVLWAVATLQTGAGNAGALRLPALLFAAALGWCLAQALMPAWPAAAHPAWREASEILGRPLPALIAPDPEAAVRGVLRLAGYAAVFFLCHAYAADERRARILLWTIASAATIASAYGLFSWIAGSRTVLWYERTFEAGNLSATFPNRNAFADYAALGLLCAMSITALRAALPAVSRPGFLWAAAIAVQYVLARSWVLVYAAVAIFAALVLTHSRAGLAAALLAIAVFLPLARPARMSRRTLLAAGAVAASVAAVLIWIAGAGLGERLAKLPGATDERLTIYRLTAGMIAERPLAGTGLGSFADVFPAVRTPEIRPRIDYAHNAFLENALEMGLPAAAAFYAALLAVVATCLRARRASGGVRVWPSLGIAATTLVAVHSLFDYSAQFPAVALTYAAILGIAAARSRISLAEPAPSR